MKKIETQEKLVGVKIILQATHVGIIENVQRLLFVSLALGWEQQAGLIPLWTFVYIGLHATRNTQDHIGIKNGRKLFEMRKHE